MSRIFHQLEAKYNLHNQGSNIQIGIYLMHLNFFSNLYSLFSLMIIFLEYQRRRFIERKPEHN